MWVFDTLFAPYWKALFPAHNPDTFRFATTTLPFTSQQEVVLTLIVYFIAVHLGQRVIRWLDIRPLSLKWLFFLHNAVLSAGSLLLLAMIVEIALPKISEFGLMYGVCHGKLFKA